MTSNEQDDQDRRDTSPQPTGSSTPGYGQQPGGPPYGRPSYGQEQEQPQYGSPPAGSQPGDGQQQ